MILYAESEGRGETVVVLHGLMGSCENWRSIRATLADRFRVICLDLPNHGRSPRVAHFDLPSIGDDVAETMSALCGPGGCVGAFAGRQGSHADDFGSP